MLLAVYVAAAVGCARDDAKPARAKTTSDVAHEPSPAPSLTLTMLEWGAAVGSLSPRLQLGEDGAVVASWLEPEGQGFRLQWREAGHSEPPQTVVRGAELLQNWADVPAVAALGRGQHVALWPAFHAAGEADGEAADPGYGLRWSQHDAQGWAASASLPSDVRGPEYGFVSVASQGPGRAAVFWLDGRASKGHHGGQMQLRSAIVSPDGVVERRLVDDRVCDCCQTSAAASARGPVVAYRDRSAENVRDIWLAGPGVDQRRRVGADQWQLEGCPVNGPAVSIRGPSTAVAWFTAVADQPRVHVAFADGDGPFGTPIIVDGGQPMGRVDAVWVGDDRVAVSWIEKTSPSKAEVRLRVVGPSGVAGEAMRVASTTADRRAGFPQLELGSDASMLLAWTHAPQGEPAQVRFASVPLAQLQVP